MHGLPSSLPNRLSLVQSADNISISKLMNNSDPKTQTLDSLRDMYKNLHDAVAEFLSHNGPTMSIRNLLNNCFFETDNLFAQFINQITKAGRGSIPLKSIDNSFVQNPLVKNTAIPFLMSWSKTTNILTNIRNNESDLWDYTENQNDYIHKAESAVGYSLNFLG